MDFDVVVIGGGPAGLSFSRILAGGNLRIAVIEKQAEKELAHPSYDGREIALTHLSQRIMQDHGMWGRIPSRDISLIKDAKVLNGDLSDPLFFDHRNSGKENLGFMVSNHLIRKAAYEVVKGSKHVKLMTGCEVAGVSTDAAAGRVTLANGKVLKAPLVVAADSRFSPTRKMMGIPVEMRDFGRVCIVCRMKLDRDHDDTAYECFFYDHTLAVLPLNGRYCSVVITVAADKAHEFLNLSPAAFGRKMTEKMEGRFGQMSLDTKLYPYPLVGTYADCFYARRYALLGDAAVGMHPVTAHGFNFGLRGADTLAREILKAQQLGLDIGGRSVLESYHLHHRRATRPMYLGTNAIVALYTATTPAARFLRKGVLKVGQVFAPAQKLIMNQLTEAA